MNDQAETFSILQYQWEEVKTHLESSFSARKGIGIKEWMDKGITLFFQLLYLTNGENFTSTNQILYQQFQFKPINMEERIGFIMDRPSLFHSYRQLSELMLELEKLYVKSIIVKKSSRS